MSPMVLWHLSEKCLTMVWFLVVSKMFDKSIHTLKEVCPTYCILHLVQVMQYIRLELLHETNFMQRNSLPVVWLLMVPVLFSRGQYLQDCVLLQNLKPLFNGLVPNLGLLTGVLRLWCASAPSLKNKCRGNVYIHHPLEPPYSYSNG